MAIWQNIPFFLILIPLASASLTSILKPRRARAVMETVVVLVFALSAGFFISMLRYGGSFTYKMGAFGAPFGNELKASGLEALIGLAFSAVMLLSVTGGRDKMLEQIEPHRISLYCVMEELLLSSLMVLTYTNDIFTGYVFIEITTIAAFSLISARDKSASLFASAKYMIMNLLGSGLFLLGVSMLYCLTGHLLMPQLKASVAALSVSGAYARPLIVVVALITIGLAVKSALYPFHTWLPDAYSNATPGSSAMLSSLVSKAYIFLLLKFIYSVIGRDIFSSTGISNILFIFSLAGILLGSIDAIMEKRIRRMIAFSSVAQIGYIFLGLSFGTDLGAAAAVFHIMAHAFAKSMLFIAADGLTDASNSSSRFHDLRGAGFRSPFSGIAFTVGALSLVGVPVFGGFASKIILANAAMELSQTRAVWVLIVLVISTALNTAYFLKTVITLYDRPSQKILYAPPPKRSISYKASLIAFSVMNLIIGILAYPILSVIREGIGLL